MEGNRREGRPGGGRTTLGGRRGNIKGMDNTQLEALHLLDGGNLRGEGRRGEGEGEEDDAPGAGAPGEREGERGRGLGRLGLLVGVVVIVLLVATHSL